MYLSENLKKAEMNETVEEKKVKMRNPFIKRMAAVATAIMMAGAGFGLGLGASGLITKSELPKNDGYYSEATGNSLNEPSFTGYTPSLLTSSSANVSIVDVVKRTANSIVSIQVISTVTSGGFGFFGRQMQEYESKSAGSGVIFFEDNDKIYILTNFHVVEGADSVTISIDDELEAPASFVGNDKNEDLAIISVLKSDLKAAGIDGYTIASFGNSDLLEVGETVVAIGNAIGEGKSATAGIVSALNKRITIDGINYVAIQTDATINPGNSGGALVNTNSEVIGINTAKISGNGVEGMGYSIPSNTAKQVIDQIMTHGSPKKPYLGIEPLAITDEILAAYTYLPGYGIHIRGVFQGTGAAEAGLRANDIITAVNGVNITTVEELNAVIAETGVGGKMLIDVLRPNNNRVYSRITVEAVIGDQNSGSGVNF